ncbi:GDP-mannose 4,6-dehydratase [Candidatus Gracilibacteria bacterium]|nr:GDP-mannose 4,6-dehydratase [Candidatus Gracilibacteria bacterium]
MKALVTGSGGFVGKYLVDYLKTLGYETHGIERSQSSQNNLHIGDITNREFVASVIEKVRPDLVFHLAAYSLVKTSFQDPTLVHKVNVEGSRNILDALQSKVPQARFLYVSSAVVYGMTTNDHLSEIDEVVPTSPYAQSRIDTEKMLLHYPLPWIVSRSFNHTGPGQAAEYVLSDWCKQAVAIELGKQEPIIKVGNIESVRDFMDVRDIVKIYHLLLTTGVSYEIYNVGSGVRYRLGDLLNMILSFINVPVQVEVDGARERSQDTTLLVADTTKLNQLIGEHQLLHSIEQTLLDILSYWRSKLSS